MKKLLFTIAMIMCVTAINAQDSLKPVSGDITLELDFTPFGSYPINVSFIKGRYFIADDLAVRAGFNFDIKYNNAEPNEGVDEWKQSSILFGIYPGVEKHFGNMKRVSPYVGGVIGIAVKSSTESYIDKSGSSEVETKYVGAWSDGSQRGFFVLDFNLVSGVDVYVVKKLYLGVEMGMEIRRFAFQEVTKEVTGADSQIISTKSNSLHLGINFNSAIRLGYAF